MKYLNNWYIDIKNDPNNKLPLWKYIAVKNDFHTGVSICIFYIILYNTLFPFINGVK